MRQPDGMDVVRRYGPGTTRELAAKAGVGRPELYKCLNLLADHGDLVKTIVGQDAYWEVPA